MKELIQLKKKGMFCETEHVNDLILYFHVKVLLKIQTYILSWLLKTLQTYE